MYLWPSRIGYSLSPSPDVICNFISLDDVSCAEPLDPECKDSSTKCDFVVQVVPNLAHENIEKSNGEDLSFTKTVPKSNGPEHQLSQRSYAQRPTWFNFVKHGLQRALKSPAAHDLLKEDQAAHKPYFFRASSVSERNKWIHHINLAVANFQNEKQRHIHEQDNFLLRNQAWVRKIYTSITFRMATAFCVGINFLVMVCVPISKKHEIGIPRSKT